MSRPEKISRPHVSIFEKVETQCRKITRFFLLASTNFPSQSAIISIENITQFTRFIIGYEWDMALSIRINEINIETLTKLVVVK